jgi:hypothetical protein
VASGRRADHDVPEPARPARAACRSYIETSCGRRHSCGIYGDAAYAICLDEEAQCPDRFFLPGTGYTLESLSACTSVWESYDCTAISAGIAPECVQPGTRAVGESCRFPAQCTSQVCTVTDGSSCGVCLAQVPSGAACEMSEQCPDGHLCRFGRCLQRLTLINPDVRLPAGATCTYDGRCAEGTLCAPTALGAECVSIPALGEACLPEGPALGAPRCDLTQYCSPEGTCQKLPFFGGACAPGLLPCQIAGYCDSPDGAPPGTCRSGVFAGQPCDPGAQNHPCDGDMHCRCVDAACTSSLCAGETMWWALAWAMLAHLARRGSARMVGVCSARRIVLVAADFEGTERPRFKSFFRPVERARPPSRCGSTAPLWKPRDNTSEIRPGLLKEGLVARECERQLSPTGIAIAKLPRDLGTPCSVDLNPHAQDLFERLE